MATTTDHINPNSGIRLMGKAHGRLVHARRVNVIAERVAGVLEPDLKLLDVGCGDGELAAALGSRVPGLEVSGIEIQPRPDCAIDCTQFDGVHIPYPSNSFDVCMFVDVLHHTTDPLVILREGCRVSRKFVLIKDHFSENALDDYTLQFMDWVGNRPHGVVLPYNFLSSAQWNALYEQLGLREVRTERHLPIYPPPFSLIFGRKLQFISLLEK